MGLEEPRLPPGYQLDRSDPDIWALRRPEGWAVAYFSARGTTKEAIEQVAWKGYEDPSSLRTASLLLYNVLY
jgi:hypothetical protein